MRVGRNAICLRTQDLSGHIRLAGNIVSNQLRGMLVFLGLACFSPLAAAVDVRIDIEPYSNQNQVNPAATSNVIVYLFGGNTLAGDAYTLDVTQVRVASVLFGPGNARSSASLIYDFDSDGTRDIAFLFAIPDTGIACGDTEAELSGMTYGDVQFMGVDMLQTTGCIIFALPPVEVDIDPWSNANQIDPVATGNIVVAVQGASTLNGDPEDFDVTQVDPSSVSFGRGNARQIVSAPVADINGDSAPDIAFAFAIPDTGIACGDVSATLSGSTFSGLPFSATDAVETLACDGGCHPAPKTEFAVVARAGVGGRISPAITLADANSSAQFSLTPDSGFVVDSVSGCGGGGVLTGGSYTTVAITNACEITASFRIGSNTISANASAGGSISPSSATVNSGDAVSFTLLADSGYTIGAVSGCSGELVGDLYTTGPVYSSCEVSATFVPVPTYTVTAPVSLNGGTVSPANLISVGGASVSLNVLPASGYRINTITGCNGNLDGTIYTTGVIAGDCAVTATFTPIPVIEAHLSDYSVRQTDAIDLFVSTSLQSYDVVVAQVAPYRVVARYGDISGGLQPVPANAYATGPDWSSSLEITVPAEWPSGVYEFLIQGRDQADQIVQERLNFIVRARNPGQNSGVLVVDDALTINAYNGWGGRSLYGYNSASGIPGVAAALKRPGNFSANEELIEFANWSAALGYDLEWAADYDLHKIPGLLEHYETIVIVGHSEYWSRGMRNAFDAHTASGGNALILSGNTMWFQVRFEGDQMVCYKNYLDDPLLDIDNALVTTNFFDEPVYDPENRSIGASWRHGGYVNSGGHYMAADGWGGYIVADPEHELLAATGLAAGQMFGQSTHIVGYEVDGAMYEWVNGRAVATGVDGTPTNFEIVSYAPAYSAYTNFPWFLNSAENAWAGAATFGTMVLPSGGRVTNMATIDWADGLFTGRRAPHDRDGIADEQVGRITFNALRQLGHVPAKPRIKGDPDVLPGQDLGVFIWKEFFDGPYHITTSGKGAPERFTLTVISSSEIQAVSGWNLTGPDTLLTGGNWLEFDSYVSTAAEGIEFSVVPSGSENQLLALGIRRQGGTGLFDAKLGQRRKPQYPSGWMLQREAVPSPPSFTAGTDMGVFVGSDAPELPVQIRWSSNGQPLAGSLQVIAADASISATPVDMEANDQLYAGDRSIRAYGEVADDSDGVDISFTGSPARIAILASLDELFERRLVNDGQLGKPDTILLPMVTARGNPTYDPGAEPALHVWLDDYGVWHVRGSAGGEARQYSGSIESSEPIESLDELGLQLSDSVTLATPSRVEFNISISGNGEAGFSLQAAPGATLSLDLSQGPEPLRIGAESWPVANVPVNIGG
jgi:Divergent InlB B-repeat domain